MWGFGKRNKEDNSVSAVREWQDAQKLLAGHFG